MKIALSLCASALLLVAPAFAAGTDVTPPNYGTVSGPAVPSNTPGATDETGTGPDTSTGISHAQSSGAARNGATAGSNSSSQPESYGTVSGPAATRNTPGADDGTGTGPDASTGITHVQSGGGTLPPSPPPAFPAHYR